MCVMTLLCEYAQCVHLQSGSSFNLHNKKEVNGAQPKQPLLVCERAAAEAIPGQTAIITSFSETQLVDQVLAASAIKMERCWYEEMKRCLCLRRFSSAALLHGYCGIFFHLFEYQSSSTQIENKILLSGDANTWFSCV